MTPAETLTLGAYFFVVIVLAIYGWHRYYLVYLYMRNKDKEPKAGPPLDPLPVVTIQLPLYNEMYVAERLIEAVCRIDYPRELLEIQVLDDSTDETTSILDAWRGRPGFKVIHRASRDGFKGGALQVALQNTDPRAEFVIVWDADVVPFPDSIQTYLPHFFKTNGNGNETSGGVHAKHPPTPRSEVAAVQSYQWHVLNKS